MRRYLTSGRGRRTMKVERQIINPKCMLMRPGHTQLSCTLGQVPRLLKRISQQTEAGLPRPWRVRLPRELPAMPFGGSWKDGAGRKERTEGSFSVSWSQPPAHLLVFGKGRAPCEHILAHLFSREQAPIIGMASVFQIKQYAS